MASATTETTPLVQHTTSSNPSPKPQRNVTFNPTVSSSNAPTYGSSSRNASQPVPPAPVTQEARQPVLAALNSKLRRRHSSGSALAPAMSMTPAGPKAGAQRTTKNVQKLKLLPNPDAGPDGPDEESGRDVYSQFTRIKDPTARRDAARLGKDDRTKLPRVTAYCTANAYRLEDLMKFLRGRGKTRGASPKLFDECIYTPYSYGKLAAIEGPGSASAADFRRDSNTGNSNATRRFSDSVIEVTDGVDARRDDLMDFQNDPLDESAIIDNAEVPMSNGDPDVTLARSNLEGRPPRHEESLSQTGGVDFDTEVHTPEVFLFNYGTVVIWGMTVQEEARFLQEIARFETEKLGPDDVQTENFNFYYTREYQARIYNDFISLREKRSYMTKLAISHALSQSVKTSLYEDLVDNTIDTTKEIPSQIATTGKVDMSRREINMQIGELFILRINIHLQGSVLDAPELMWSEPQLDPVYQAVRSYLEIDQRVGLLTERLEVIADLLAVLKDQLTHTHGEYLEWIVIVLIAAEILVAGINIVVDLYAGVD